jgi:wobble nucleotide-excising tRNase
MLTEGQRWEYEDLSKLRFDKIQSIRPAVITDRKKKQHHRASHSVYLHTTFVKEIRLNSGERKADVSLEIRFKQGSMTHDESRLNWIQKYTHKLSHEMVNSQTSNILAS